jgi:DNA-binding CsgD family transcriptional regulator
MRQALDHFTTVRVALTSREPSPRLVRALAERAAAGGSTNAQIAARLYISVRSVGSHLDRIRDKTGCRRRADLTRLALQANLAAGPVTC